MPEALSARGRRTQFLGILIVGGLILVALVSAVLWLSVAAGTAAIFFCMGVSFFALLAVYAGKLIVDEERYMQARLEARDARYRQTLELLPEGVVILKGEDGVIEWVNTMAGVHLGITSEDVGSVFTDRLIASQPAFCAWLRSRDFSRHYALETAGGSVLLDAAVVAPDERHTIIVTHDVTERRRVDDMRRDFVANVSHELKTPLSLITAPVEELLLNPHIGKTTRNRLELVNRNAGALKTLLEQILDLRKYESHKMELAAVQTDASEFLRGIAELFKPLADQLQIQFSQEIPNDPLILWIDRRKMEIVIANLLYNAFKYSRKSSGKVNLVCEEQQLSVTISVEDNGIGIARDEQSRIFERFYQARNNNSPQKSIGIGLSLVKHIVTLHHGEIEVASELNVGSLFRVRIPKGCAHLAPEQIKDSDKVPGRPFQNLPIGMDSALSDFGDDQFESEMAAETAIGNDRGMQCGLLEENTRHGAAASDGKRVSILVAEDNTALRDYLRSALENRYNVSTARNGEEAYCQAINEQPDLVLTDIVMPGMSGIELCRKIKENSRTSAIGVILLTAHNLQNYEVSGYRVGADAYVAKPFSLEVLFSRIDNLVARQNKIHKNSQPIKEIPISEVAVEKSEDRFLVKCTETIETEIADPRFDVLQLCRKIGVSRSQLYRRILALTGLTPIQFIRSIRLKHAASFLAQDGTLPVNEVMYRVGYTNLSHFAKIFHEEFGLYPKEFALRNRSKTGKVDSASEIFSKNEPETQK